ncbi:hypothetical protein NECAME_10348 [Necator americanus]|uniref:Uncharacterized protein n=1 Tax=Necator americanus TaxID=51031 RepID=W2T8U1_NECAM|nr:hypothetical protein NECAME_10348 [Necator americanus]ETN78425.1 hypothetical protein NECAME_10348 [Necator americanus]
MYFTSQRILVAQGRLVRELHITERVGRFGGCRPSSGGASAVVAAGVKPARRMAIIFARNEPIFCRRPSSRAAAAAAPPRARHSPRPAMLSLREYSRLIYRRPLTVAITAVLLTGILPLVILYFLPIKLSQNAEIGFDTKDTELSGPRLAWQKLQQTLTTSNRINFANHPQLNVTGLARTQNVTAVGSRRNRRSWADQLFTTFSTIACYDAPIPLTMEIPTDYFND